MWSRRPRFWRQVLAVMRRPTGSAHRQPRGDGGNSATLPEESTKDTVKTIRAGKAGRPASPVVHPVCISLYTDSGAAGARPSLRPLAFNGAKRTAKLGRKKPRERAGASAMTRPDEVRSSCHTLVIASAATCPPKPSAKAEAIQESLRGGSLDCFVARAPRNDVERAEQHTRDSRPGRSTAAPKALQRARDTRGLTQSSRSRSSSVPHIAARQTRRWRSPARRP